MLMTNGSPVSLEKEKPRERRSLAGSCEWEIGVRHVELPVGTDNSSGLGGLVGGRERANGFQSPAVAAA